MNFESRSQLSLVRNGFVEQFVRVLSPIELAGEIRTAREKIRNHSVPSAAGGVDLIV